MKLRAYVVDYRNYFVVATFTRQQFGDKSHLLLYACYLRKVIHWREKLPVKKILWTEL